MKEEYVLGKNGEIQEIISKDEFVRRFPKEHLEINPSEHTFTPDNIFFVGKWKPAEKLYARLNSNIKPLYKKWGKFGPNGDVIGIIKPNPGKEDRIVTFIARRAFPKPALAVDCVIFVRDEADNYFFVGIKRGKEPGKGKPAFVGGFIDVNGYEMETALSAILREVKEEVGIQFTRFYGFVDQGFTSQNMPVMAHSANFISLETALYYVGDIETGDEEKLEHLGAKRVHRTFVYTCLFNLPGIQTPETVREYFKAGSDAAELAMSAFSPRSAESVQMMADSFGLSHHRKMFPKALALITM